MVAMSKKPVIAVDIDDVLMPHFEDLAHWYNTEYGTRLTLADNYSDDNAVWGTDTEEEAIRRVQRFYGTKEFLQSKPAEEAEAVLRHLSERYELVIVTARDTILEEATHEWLQRHFRELFRKVHFTAHYALDGTRKSKADLCKEINASYLIDDTPHHALPAAKAGVKVLLFGDYPWNQIAELPAGVVRCKDWQAVQEYFDGLSS